MNGWVTVLRDSHRRVSQDIVEAITVLVDKYMGILNIPGAMPTVHVRDNLAPGWLGRTTWIPSQPDTTTVELQRSILDDPTTLERVIAHEMIHHLEMISQSDADKAMVKLGMKTSSHGAFFREHAALINEIMEPVFGPDFVTVKSDQRDKIASNERAFYVLIRPLFKGSNQLGWAWAARLGPKAVQVVEAELQKGAKLVMDTNIRWTSGPKIVRFGGVAVPRDAADIKALRDLYENAPSAEF